MRRYPSARSGALFASAIARSIAVSASGRSVLISSRSWASFRLGHAQCGLNAQQRRKAVAAAAEFAEFDTSTAHQLGSVGRGRRHGDELLQSFLRFRPFLLAEEGLGKLIAPPGDRRFQRDRCPQRSFGQVRTALPQPDDSVQVMELGRLAIASDCLLDITGGLVQIAVVVRDGPRHLRPYRAISTSGGTMDGGN